MIALLDPYDRQSFPDPRVALLEPNGLLAVGGDLSPGRLHNAYRRGIFPWFSAGDPILWWSPDPRTVIFPKQLHISRSLRKHLRKHDLSVSFDHDFFGVIHGCAQPRDDQGGTWLLPQMIAAYQSLHAIGLAHSVEVWRDKELVGGLYGVAIGRAFFGESMFSRVTDASKVALVHLCKRLADWRFGLIDCQMRTDHLVSMGAIEIPREEFLTLLEEHCPRSGFNSNWFGGFEDPTTALETTASKPKTPRSR